MAHYIHVMCPIYTQRVEFRQQLKKTYRYKKSLYWSLTVGTRGKTDFKGFIDAYSCFVVLLMLKGLIYSDIDVLHELSAIEGKDFGVFGFIHCVV